MLHKRSSSLILSGTILHLIVSVFLLFFLAHLAGGRHGRLFFLRSLEAANIAQEQIPGLESRKPATSEVFGSRSAVYVLPYPSFMPGHKLYRVKQVLDDLLRFWTFGNFARHKYELGMTDKKLVEVKTLFEYGQYFLATQALADSSQHWQKAADYLEKAKGEGKDISQKLANFQAAAEKHREVLEELKEDLPEEFLWQPEKEESQMLAIGQLLDEAIGKIDLISN